MLSPEETIVGSEFPALLSAGPVKTEVESEEAVIGLPEGELVNKLILETDWLDAVPLEAV